jgi:hypothetical protein
MLGLFNTDPAHTSERLPRLRRLALLKQDGRKYVERAQEHGIIRRIALVQTCNALLGVVTRVGEPSSDEHLSSAVTNDQIGWRNPAGAAAALRTRENRHAVISEAFFEAGRSKGFIKLLASGYDMLLSAHVLGDRIIGT